MKLEKEVIGSLFILLSAAGFGTLPILVDLALTSALNIPTVLIFRFVIALALVGLYIYTSAVFTSRYGTASENDSETTWKRYILSPRLAGIAFSLGAFGYALISWLFFIGVNQINAGLATVVLYTYPLFVVFLGVLLLDESVTQIKLLSVVITIVGVSLISGASFDLLNPLGVIATVSAAVLYAFYIVISRRTLGSVDEVVLTTYVLSGAATICIFIGALTGRIVSPSATSEWAVLIGIGTFSTGVPIFAFFAGLKRIDASKAGVVATAEPVVAVALGAVLLNETIPVPAYAGTILVITGVALIQNE
jgi:drug/metabolite transporter (DMT)-like permease